MKERLKINEKSSLVKKMREDGFNVEDFSDRLFRFLSYKDR